MDRIFRVSENNQAVFAIERDGELRRATGDPFAALSPGAAIAGGLGAVRLLPPSSVLSTKGRFFGPTSCVLPGTSFRRRTSVGCWT